MSGPILRFATVALAAASCWCAEPKISSVHPLTVAVGRETEVTIRGTALAGATGMLFSATGAAARLLRSSDTEAVAVVTASEPANPFRLVTPGGVSNEIKLRSTSHPTGAETGPVTTLPVVINGVLAKRGETDSFRFEARAGEMIAIEAVSGFGAFDPAISIWARSASWFDPERLERVAFADEPLYFPGLDTTARLVHRFEKAGVHEIRISAFQGQGGPDYSYSLLLMRASGPDPNLHPVDRPEWPERWFTRRIGPEWLSGLAARGSQKELKPIESYRAVVEGSGTVPVIKETGLVEGRLGAPDEAHEIRLEIAEPRDLAIEIETPEATMPRFNPVVRVMQPDGNEVVTNVYTKLNNNGLYMMKMIQAKTTVTLRSVGEYRIQIRDITSDRWSKDFAYRVLIRPQVPHIGEAVLVEERVNLEPGQSKPLTVNIDREEGFKGHVAISVEGLPPGVTAVTGLENPLEKPPLPNAGRRERYYPIPQTATVMLVADSGAAETPLPVRARVVARPVVDGRVGEPVLSKQIPVMVLRRRPS